MPIDNEAMEYIKQRWDVIAEEGRNGRRSIPSFDEEIRLIADFYDDYQKLRTNNRNTDDSAKGE